MRLLAAPSCFRIAGCAVAVPLSLPPYFPVLVALFDGFPKSWCALQHPTFSRSPSSRSLQVFACRFSPVLDRGGHAYGVSCLSGPPSSLGWLFSFGFPRAGVRMLAAPVTHRVPLPDIITPCCKSSLHFGQTIRAGFKWLVVFTGTLGLERYRCALWLRPPSKAFHPQ